MKAGIIGLLLIGAGVFSAKFIQSMKPASPPLFDVPSNWKEIDLGHFLFYIPPDMKPESVQGFDSDVWQYSNSSIILNIDWGQYPGAFKPYRGRPEYKEEWIEINGKTAHFWSYHYSEEYITAAIGDKRYNATICFADTGIGEQKLTLRAYCKTNSDQQTAKIIFQSIRFK